MTHMPSSEARVLSTESAFVYINHKPESVPQHPGEGWTRFVCISDTHSHSYDVPLGDILLHAGDVSSWGYPRQVKNMLLWMSGLKHTIKIFIAGNHDLCLDSNVYEDDTQISEEDRKTLREFRASVKSQLYTNANVFYLEHEEISANARSGKTWHVYGSPATPRYASGAFQYTTAAEADALYQKIPNKTEILITHTPPKGVLDVSKRDKHAGCEQLSKRLDALPDCRLHVFGHIHEGAGAVVLSCGRVAVNAALALGSRPIVVDLKNVSV